jgi:hypothetical protein
MKASERRLALLALGVMAIIAGLVLSKYFMAWQRTLDSNEAAVVAESDDAKFLLKEMPLWNARGQWLTKTMPVEKSNLEAETETLTELVDKAKAQGLSVEQQQYQEQQKNEYFNQHGVVMTVKGELPNVFRWIYSVQSPADFRVVPQMRIVPDKQDPSKVDCTIQFWHWYQPTIAQGP